MKIYILAASLLALAACGSTPPQNDMANNVQDVAANNMIADDVTEVQDDSATVPPSGDTSVAPGQPISNEQLEKDEALAKKDRGEQ